MKVMFTNLQQVKRQHKALGGHFFDRDTMKFFGSRIESPLIGGKWFVTSEQYGDEPKRFTVRWVVDLGYRIAIETVGGFQEFDNLDDALTFIGNPEGYREYQERSNAVIKSLEEAGA